MDRNHFKQRIVGALVLVALGAIVIPFLLDMHEGDKWWGKGNIPKKPANGFVTRVLPLDQWAKQAQSTMADTSQQLDAVPTHAPATSAAPAPGPSVSATPSPVTPSNPAAIQSASAPAAAGSQTPTPASAMEGWVVQLGSFSNQANAEELVARLRKQGYQVFVEKVAQGGQTIYRVRIGPQRQRADAEAIRDKLARDLQLKALVLHLP